MFRCISSIEIIQSKYNEILFSNLDQFFLFIYKNIIFFFNIFEI